MTDFDAVTGSHPVPVARLVAAVTVAALVGLLLHPAALTEALNGLPVHPVVEAAIAYAERWQAWCAELGLSSYFDTIRGAVQSLRELTW